MPIYNYRVKDRSGLTIAGEMESPSEKLVLEKLKDSDYFVLSIKEKRKAILSSLFQLGKRIDDQDIIIFTRQLCTLLDSGIPINTSLQIISKQIPNPILSDICDKMRSDIENGSTLADAIRKYPLVFDQTFIAIVESGEMGGILGENLERLASVQEKSLQRKSKVKQAMAYPVILLFAAVFGIFFLIMFVFPLFSKIFSRANVELPLPTRVLIGISTFLRGNWFLIFIAIVVLFFLLVKFRKTKKGKFALDRLKLKLPLFGDLFRKASISSFAHTFQALNHAGIPLIKGLEVVSKVVGNLVIQEAILEVKSKIGEGSTIAKPFEQTKEFPQMMVDMISVGEESGRLDDMLDKIALYYDQEVDYKISKLATSLEPILIGVMGFVVAFMYLSLIMPMLQLLKVVRAGGLG